MENEPNDGYTEPLKITSTGMRTRHVHNVIENSESRISLPTPSNGKLLKRSLLSKEFS